MAVIDASQTPQMTDKLIFNNEVWTIVKIIPGDTIGVPMDYKLQVRK